jgi:hypothetical protein
VRAAIGIVFEPLNLCGNPILIATEIDDSIVSLMPTATVPGCDVAVVVTTRSSFITFGECCDWLSFM